MYSSFWNLGLVIFRIGWARGIGNLCFLMFLFACWVFVFAFGFGFLNFFFVRFRSRSVRCRFALDLMEAAVAWLGTI